MNSQAYRDDERSGDERSSDRGRRIGNARPFRRIEQALESVAKIGAGGRGGERRRACEPCLGDGTGDNPTNADGRDSLGIGGDLELTSEQGDGPSNRAEKGEGFGNRAGDEEHSLMPTAQVSELMSEKRPLLIAAQELEQAARDDDLSPAESSRVGQRLGNREHEGKLARCQRYAPGQASGRAPHSRRSRRSKGAPPDPDEPDPDRGRQHVEAIGEPPARSVAEAAASVLRRAQNRRAADRERDRKDRRGEDRQEPQNGQKLRRRPLLEAAGEDEEDSRDERSRERDRDGLAQRPASRSTSSASWRRSSGSSAICSTKRARTALGSPDARSTSRIAPAASSS